MTRLAIMPGAVASDGLRALVLTRGARSRPTVTLTAEGAPASAVQAVEVPPPPVIAPIIGALRTRCYYRGYRRARRSPRRSARSMPGAATS